MPIPSGVITKTLVVGSGMSITGDTDTAIEVLVTPYHPSAKVILWTASTPATPLVNFFEVRRSPAGTAVILDLPVSDQVGYIDQDMNPITGWYYKITARYLLHGRKVGTQVTKNLKVLSTSANILDFDLLPANEGGNEYQGPPGASAYQLALLDGFSGTLDEWLASLKGAPGDLPSNYSFSTIIGDGQSTTFIVQHNLNKPSVHISLTSATAPFKQYIAESYNTSENSVTLVFGTPPPLAAYKVYITAV